MIRNGLGPRPLPGRFPVGLTLPWTGFSLVGAIPFARALIRLGLSLRRNCGVVGQRLRDLRCDPAFGGGLVGHLLELVRGLVHDLIGFRRHFFAGGSSPVATRQIAEAALRAASVATAASEA